MSNLLPPGYVCTAWWYLTNSNLPSDPSSRIKLGTRAARLGRQLGIMPVLTIECDGRGVLRRVKMWPERIWAAAADSLWVVTK